MVGKEEESTALDMKDYTALRARFQHACVTSSHYAKAVLRCYAYESSRAGAWSATGPTGVLFFTVPIGMRAFKRPGIGFTIVSHAQLRHFPPIQAKKVR